MRTHRRDRHRCCTSFPSALITVLAAAALLGCCGGGADQCAAAPCLHDGVCVATDEAFVCLCPPGYTGPTCATDVDDCDPNPCFNGGVCTDGVAGFTCACAAGFTGVQCETNADDCSAAPCANGGVCVDRVDGYECVCPAGFAGTNCETSLDDCSAAPCANGGVCIDRVDGYECVCPAGFTGATCATNIDDCDPNPCFHGGVCTDGVDRFTCACPPGVWGTQCEDVVAALAITTATPLAVAVADHPYSVQMVRTGGTSAAQWSIPPGGTNTGWLTIDPDTGLLTGTPTTADVGAVSLTIRVAEPIHPDNFAEATFTFAVILVPAPAYATSFAGTCPDGWTLTGDWECGVPQNVGPTAAHSDTQCLGTRIDTLYSVTQTFAATTATSPDITLPALPQEVTFWAWVDTEGATYDGFNLQLSEDGGTSFAVVTAVTPAYPLTIAGKPAWGGHRSALGWEQYRADLTAYAGKTVRLRFAFQSDGSGTFPGVYVDDVTVAYPE